MWSQQLLEDRLAGGERLGRRLGGLELGALERPGAATRRRPRRPRARQVRPVPARCRGGGRRGAGRDRRGAAAVAAGRRRSGAAGRPARSSRARRSRAGRSPARSGARSAPRRRGGRDRGRDRSRGRDRRGAGRGRGRRRGPRRRGAAAVAVVASAAVADRRGPRAAAAAAAARAAASRFGAAPPSAERGAATIRAGSAPMPRTPRLPGVRISKSRSSSPTPNVLAGAAQRLLDGLAGELLVRTHVSVVSLVGPGGPRSRWSDRRGRPVRLARRWSSAPGRPLACVGSAAGARRPGSAACGPRRRPGSSRRAGTSPPQPTIRYCWTIEKSGGHDPVDEQAGRQEPAVEDRDQRAGSASSGAGSGRSGRRWSGRAGGSIIRDWTSWSSAETIARMPDPMPRTGVGEDRVRLAQVDAASTTRVDAGLDDRRWRRTGTGVAGQRRS